MLNSKFVTNRRQKVLLTGGAGFIGSHVAEALLRRGVQLAIVDELNDFYAPQRKEENLSEVRRFGSIDFIKQDICNQRGLHAIFESFRPDAVVHLAARAGVRPSLDNPALYERVNIAGSLNLLDLCREYRVPRFIFGSSSSVYGVAERVPFTESNTELRPISPYAATKLSGEMLCFTYAYLYGLTVVCLRFFTVYGPRQRPDLAIHKFTELLETGQTLPIFGDGRSGRDYTYVEDIVAGVVASIDYVPTPGPGNSRFEIFNLGNSQPVLLEELVQLLERATGHKAVRQQLPEQPGDVPITWADISKAKRLLGYDPQTPIAKGLEQFVSWYRRARITT